MSEGLEHAREGIERAHHAHESHGDSAARWVAILVALFAAGLALADVGEKASQTSFLMHHIAMTDDYAYYQAKNLRIETLQSSNDILRNLPGGITAAIAERIKAADATIARLRDNPKEGNGMKQLLAQAEENRRHADHALHREHGYAGAAGALQIAILLASVSIVTRMAPLRYAAGAIGGLAMLFGLAVLAGAV